VSSSVTQVCSVDSIDASSFTCQHFYLHFLNLQRCTSIRVTCKRVQISCRYRGYRDRNVTVWVNSGFQLGFVSLLTIASSCFWETCFRGGVTDSFGNACILLVNCWTIFMHVWLLAGFPAGIEMYFVQICKGS
jgi:hypothetical protein